MLFLGELDEVSPFPPPLLHRSMRPYPDTWSPQLLELTQQPEFSVLIPSLFYRISECLMSQHFQVAERAMFLWNNETVVVRITESREAIFPMCASAFFTFSNCSR